MAKEKILVVDDEEDVLELVRFNLSREGYRVFCAATGEDALESLGRKRPDLIVLDLMLPGIDGLEIAKRLKNDPKTKYIPIVMLTAKSEETDVLLGLALGADDYVTKPFSPRILVARINTVLRRKRKDSHDEQTAIRIHGLVVCPGRYEVLYKNKPIKLTLKEFGILLHFVRNPGWVFTRLEIVNAVSGEDSSVTDRSVDVQILALRRKLGSAARYIETVRGVGYRFKD